MFNRLTIQREIN